MATNTPTLEQLTGSIDDLPNSLDSLDGLPWCNPTLEQLDGWGTLEYINNFGYTMDQLGTGDRLCVLIGQGSADVAVTATAEILFAQLVDASVTVSATASAQEFTRIRTMAGSATSAASVDASASFITRVDASVDVAITSTGEVKRIQSVSGTAEISLAESSEFVRTLAFDASVSSEVTATSENAVTFVNNADVSTSLTVLAEAKVLGEDWTDVDDGTETWTDLTVGSEIWSNVTTGSEVWAVQ